MKTLFLASCLVAILSGAVHAGIIAYEPVAYPPGALNLKGPALGFSAPWAAEPGVVVVAAGLNHPLALPVQGGSVAGFFNFVDPLINPIAPTAGKEFWASYLLFHSGPNDQAFMGLSAAGAALGSLPDVALGVRLGQYGIFVGGAFFPCGVPFTPNGTTDILLAHFVAGGAVWSVDFWVDKIPPALPDLSLNVPPVTYQTMVNHNQSQFGSDEYRLGDTLGDVAAAVTPALGATWGRIKQQYR